MELLVAHTNLATDLSCSTFSAVVFLALKKSFIFDCKPDDGWCLCFDKEGVEGTAVGPGKAGSEYRWRRFGNVWRHESSVGCGDVVVEDFCRADAALEDGICSAEVVAKDDTGSAEEDFLLNSMPIGEKLSI